MKQITFLRVLVNYKHLSEKITAVASRGWPQLPTQLQKSPKLDLTLFFHLQPIRTSSSVKNVLNKHFCP